MRFPVLIIFITAVMSASSLFASDCTEVRYRELVVKGKAAENAMEWGRAAESYSTILTVCRDALPVEDLPKAYDSLGTAQLMLEQYQSAILSCEKCIEADRRYNACLMIAAKAYEQLGDKERAVESAQKAAAIEPYDDYSAAVGILANDFLRKQLKK